jgi:hypothetical protein
MFKRQFLELPSLSFSTRLFIGGYLYQIFYILALHFLNIYVPPPILTQADLFIANSICQSNQPPLSGFQNQPPPDSQG